VPNQRNIIIIENEKRKITIIILSIV